MNLELDRQAKLSPDPDTKEVFFRSGFAVVAAVVCKKLVRANNTKKLSLPSSMVEKILLSLPRLERPLQNVIVCLTIAQL